MRISRRTLQAIVTLTGLTPRMAAVQTGFPITAIHGLVQDMGNGREMSVNEIMKVISTGTVQNFAKMLGTTPKLEVLDTQRVIYWTVPEDARARKDWLAAFELILKSEYELDKGEQVEPRRRAIFSSDEEFSGMNSKVVVGKEVAVLTAPVSFWERVRGVVRSSLMIHDSQRDLKIYITGHLDKATIDRVKELFNPTRMMTIEIKPTDEWSMYNDLARFGVLRGAIFLQLMQSQRYRYTFEHVEMAAMQFGVTPDALIDVMFRATQHRAKLSSEAQAAIPQAKPQPAPAVAELATDLVSPVSPPSPVPAASGEPPLRVVGNS